MALPPVVQPCEEDIDGDFKSLADNQYVARCPAGIFNQSGGGGPVSIGQESFV